jgi:hypothetical protein
MQLTSSQQHPSRPKITRIAQTRLVTHSGRFFCFKLALRLTQKKVTSKKKVIIS